MKKYNKLVRDKIVSDLKKKGLKPKYHRAGKVEKLEKLFEKFNEEIEEFFKARKKSDKEEELADVREVMYAIYLALVEHYKLDKKIVKSIQRKKAREKGRFEKNIILDEA